VSAHRHSEYEPCPDWQERISKTDAGGGLNGYDFLGNREKRRKSADTESAAFRAFCQSWYDKFGSKIVGVKDLFTLVEEQELLTELVSAETEHGRRKKLGNLIQKRVDRHYGDFKILERDTDNSGRKLYQLEFNKVVAVPPGIAPPSANTPPLTGSSLSPTFSPSHFPNVGSRLIDSKDEPGEAWSFPDTELASILFYRQCEARMLHRVYLDDKSAQIYDFCHAVIQCRSDWRTVTDLALVKFATSRRLLSGILFAADEGVLIDQLTGCFQEMNFCLDGLLEISLYDRFRYEGRWVSRYSIRDLNDPDFDPILMPGRAATDDPLSIGPFDVDDYLGGEYYGAIVDLCRCLWEAGNRALTTSQILECIYFGNFIPGFGSPCGEMEFSYYLTDLRHLEFLLDSVQGFEFEGFMIEATRVVDAEGNYYPAYELSLMEGYPIPDLPTESTAASRRQRYLKPYRFTKRDAVRLLSPH
jgi:hypothetical protein